MINWIFPIAGKGTRTQEHGKFKPFIDIQGKTMIERCLDNLRSKFSPEDEFYFVTTQAFEEEFNVTKTLKSILSEYKVNVIVVIATPRGQALSVRIAVNEIENDNPCIIINCDQLTLFDLPDPIRKLCVYMPIYFTNHGKSCYVNIDIENDTICDIQEKELISNYASSGTFIFGSTQLLRESITWYYEKSNDTDELYLGPCINYVAQYLDVPWEPAYVIPITTYMKIDLGTDEQIEKYLKYLNTLRINSFSNYQSHGYNE